MFPMVVEKVEDENTRIGILRHLFAIVEQRCVPAPAKSVFVKKPNYMAMLVSLDLLTDKKKKDHAISNMILRGSVPSYLFEPLLDQVTSQPIETQLRNYVM